MRAHAHIASIVTLAFVAGSGAALDAEETPTSFFQALRQAKLILDLRYRHERVAEDAFSDRHANATTLRSVLGFETKSWHGLAARVEVEDVSVVGAEGYVDAAAPGESNGVRGRPVIGDPEGTALHRAFLRLKHDRWTLQLGRDEITWGDHRFVGNVGWRQHHQSFDAASLRFAATPSWTLSYARLASVQRINRATDELDGDLLRAETKLGAAGALALYALRLDYEAAARSRFSSATAGVEWSGSRPAGPGKVLWELEAAHQQDAGSNPGRVDAGYAFALVGYGTPTLSGRAGWEVLEGSARDGQLDTPLATLHKFNGWADKFLVTPTNGLVDRYLQLDGTLGGIGWTAAYHDFTAATGDAAYGTELDVQLLHKLANGLALGLKGALYDADAHASDTSKWMLWAEWSL